MNSLNKRSRFVRKLGASALGHFCLYGALMIGVAFALFGWPEYSAGSLTIGRGFEIAAVSLSCGGTGGILIWFLITKPLLQRRDIFKR